MAVVIYLDICCLKRPFDDQRSTGVQLETTDDQLIALGRRNRENLGVRITDPTTLVESLTRGEA